MTLHTTQGLQQDDFLRNSREGHPRKRERWLALFWISQGVSQSEVARRLGRKRQTIQMWKENFEQYGSESLNFTRPGGRRRTLTEEQEELLAYLVATQYPRDVGLSGIRWNLKKVASYCQHYFEKELSTEACRHVLHRNGLGLKLPKKN